MAEIFQASSAGVSRSVSERVVRFRRQQSAALKQQLQMAQNKQAAFQARHKVAFFTEQTRLVMEQIKQLELDASRAQLQVQQDTLQLQSIARELAARPEDIRVTSTVRHRTRVKIEELRTELRGLQERYTDNNPKVVAIQQQIRTLETSLHQAGNPTPEEESFAMDPVVKELKIRQAELNSGLSGSRSNIQSLQAQIQQQQKKLNQYALLEKDFNNLQREIERISENLRENDFRLAEAENAMQGNISSFDILERASAPTEPLPTRRKLLVLMAIAAGFSLGLASLWLRTLFAPRLLSLKQLTALQFPCLGVMFCAPHTPAAETQLLLTLQHFFSKLAAIVPATGPRLVVLAAHGEGGLSASFAQSVLQVLQSQGKQLVLIDASPTPQSTPAALNAWLHSAAAAAPEPLPVSPGVVR
jgi:uncharacterized protein involved in exopolysaccharide biosynthesis